MMNPSIFVIVPIINILLCLGVGTFVLTRDYKNPVNLGFSFGLVSFICVELGNALVIISGQNIELLILGLRIGIIGQLLIPPSWLIFSSTFARTGSKQLLIKWTPVIILLFIISILFGLFLKSQAFISLKFPATQIGPLSTIEPLLILGKVGHYCYVYLTVATLFSLVLLENTFRFSQGGKRWQIKYVVLGVSSSLLFFIYYFSQIMLFSSVNIELMKVLSFVILFSVSLLTVFIVRHRLLNVDIFVSRYIVYSSVTVLIVGIYFIVVGVSLYGIRYYDLPLRYSLSTLIVFVAIVLLFIAVFSTSIRRKIQLFLNRNFYKHKYEFRDKWMESIDRISSKTSVDEISKTLIDMISKTMVVESVFLWLYLPGKKSFLAFNGFSNSEYEVINYKHPLIGLIKKYKSPFFVSEKVDEVANENMKSFFRQNNLVLCSPLNAGGEIEGFVFLGSDISGEPYISDDFELLSALTTQAAVQLKNIHLSSELVTVKEVDMFNKMSSFIMHDLKNLTNSLSLVSHNAAKNIHNPEFQKDAVKTINSTVSRMRGLIEKLSTAPKRIELKKEKIDIKKLIHSSIKKIIQNKKNVTFTTDIAEMPLLKIDPHSVEMVLINLLTNAYDAIENSGIIAVNTKVEDGLINIFVKDNGVGMKKEFLEKSLFKPFTSSKKTGFGVGLYQSKLIVEAHGGEVTVESREGEGTTFIISFPL